MLGTRELLRNEIESLVDRVLYHEVNHTNLNLTHIEACYKAFRREIVQAIEIEENRFGFEPEITAKVAKSRCRVSEVGVSYYGRTYKEGKKIGWKDASARSGAS